MLDVLFMWPRSDETGSQTEIVSKHIPILKATRGLSRLRVSDGELMSRGGPPPYSHVIEATYDSLTDWMAAVDSFKERPEFAAMDAVAPLIVFFDARDA